MDKNLESQKVVDIKLFGHLCGHLQNGFDLSHELVFGFARVPLAHVQGDLHRALHALLVQRDVVLGEQLLALCEALKNIVSVSVCVKAVIFSTYVESLEIYGSFGFGFAKVSNIRNRGLVPDLF